MNIIKHKKFFVFLSTFLVLLSLVVVGIKGIHYGIEFTGGSALEMSYDTRPSMEAIHKIFKENHIDADVQYFGDKSILVRSQDVSEEGRKKLVHSLEKIGKHGKIEKFSSIGPSVGKELRTKSLYALIFVSLGIVLFLAYAFRHVSRPVSSWKYGFVAVLALFHDIIIPVGILTLLGKDIDTLYVVGLLSILGLSVNDTIVVFDRIRENLAYNHDTKIKESFDELVNRAITSTMHRSIFTSLTLVVVLIALYFVGPVATRTLSLVLLLGTIVGTYSSIFLASPLLTYMTAGDHKSKKEKKNKK